ncbi:uncharacterized protein LOC134741771 [Cydia strobilella]|uniref:uncharacterized protein LOC134741771 n=1 Tax=Cydia strobilella TaxID=1100964 RepID=UPI003004E226
MALYGAPIWADRLNAENRARLRAPQRVVAIRVVRGYRTVAWAAACALAGTMPWELDAQVLAEAHRERERRRALNEFPAPEELREERRQAQMRMRDRWKNDLEDSLYEVRTPPVVRPMAGEGAWQDRV